jgi:hypothetical protein
VNPYLDALAALQRDAFRYRWLRHNRPTRAHNWQYLPAELLDEAIDNCLGLDRLNRRGEAEAGAPDTEVEQVAP